MQHIDIIRKSLLLVTIAVLTGSCFKDKPNLPDNFTNDLYKVIYMPQAVNSPLNIPLLFKDSMQSVIYGANTNQINVSTNDIPVGFAVDVSLVASYNAQYGTNFPVLPAGSYDFTVTNTTIPAGKTATAPLEIKINPITANLTLFQPYMLPVKMLVDTLKTSGYKVNPNLTTTYFIVTPTLNLSDYSNYSRTGWTVVDFDTQEPAEGSNGGLATSALDNNKNTFWHSKWNGGAPAHPHWITIDMGKSNLLHGISYIHRQNSSNGRPNKVTIYVSDDNATWTVLDNIIMQPTGNDEIRQFFTHGFKSARYFKYFVEDSQGGTAYTYLAELNMF